MNCVRCKERIPRALWEAVVGVFMGNESDPTTPIAHVSPLCVDCTTALAEVVSGKRKWGEKNDDAP